MDLTEITRRLDELAKLTRMGQSDSRLPFEIEDRVVGSVSELDAKLLAQAVPGVELADDALSVMPFCAPDAPAVLDAMAQALRAAGRTGRWRDEALPVCADDGTLMGQVERACVRQLGIRTFAVHLVGYVSDTEPTQFWLQRRAPDKDIDPNMLDTLAGGLVSMNAKGTAMEAFGPALAREVQEEAGLEPGQYSPPVRVNTWRVQRPVEQGYLVEDLMVWQAAMASWVTPVNQDGEVTEFLRVSRGELIDLIRAGELTHEATIATLLSLQLMANTQEQAGSL